MFSRIAFGQWVVVCASIAGAVCVGCGEAGIVLPDAVDHGVACCVPARGVPAPRLSDEMEPGESPTVASPPPPGTSSSPCQPCDDDPAAQPRPTCFAADAGVPDDADLRELAARAAEAGALAQPMVRRSRQWLDDELAHIDPTSGLLNDTLYDIQSVPWTTRDTAADIYPYFAWSAYLFDRPLFDDKVHRALDFERQSTVKPETGALPYSFDTATQRIADNGMHDLLFGAAEYVKDGLTPIVELVGKGAFSSRMEEIELDSFRHGQWETPSGMLPLDDLEVSGDHLQSLARLYAMTRDTRYRDLAERIVEQYLLGDAFRPLKLSDHGNEMIGGFALLYAVERQLGSPRAAVYEPLLRNILDYIVDHALTPEGMMHFAAHLDVKGPVPAERGALSDNWGQNYVAFLIYAHFAGQPQYLAYVDHALRSLADPQFDDYPWNGTNIDGLADAVEGVIYLLAYRNVPEAERWVDAQALHLAERGWGAHKFGANTNRTAILYARAKTRGTWVHPWRDDVSWGAVEGPQGSVVLNISAASAWEGKVVFDSARYRTTMGFSCDHPRMNYLPAYFVARPAACYQVGRLDGSRSTTVTGQELLDGYAVSLPEGGRVDLVVTEVRCR